MILELKEGSYQCVLEKSDRTWKPEMTLRIIYFFQSYLSGVSSSTDANFNDLTVTVSSVLSSLLFLFFFFYSWEL